MIHFLLQKSQHLRLLFIKQYMNSNRVLPKCIKKKQKNKKQKRKTQTWVQNVDPNIHLICQNSKIELSHLCYSLSIVCCSAFQYLIKQEFYVGTFFQLVCSFCVHSRYIHNRLGCDLWFWMNIYWVPNNKTILSIYIFLEEKKALVGS